jgi:hypothetical protein
MNTTKAQQLVKVVEEAGVYADRNARGRDGSLWLERYFFYKHGQTLEGWLQKVQQALEQAGETGLTISGKEIAPRGRNGLGKFRAIIKG